MLLTSSIHTAKQKQLMGGCVTVSCITIGWRQRAKTWTPATLLVELFKYYELFDNIHVNHVGPAHSGENPTDWPIIPSVLSRGNVLMFSLDKTRVKFLIVCAAKRDTSTLLRCVIRTAFESIYISKTSKIKLILFRIMLSIILLFCLQSDAQVKR